MLIVAEFAQPYLNCICIAHSNLQFSSSLCWNGTTDVPVANDLFRLFNKNIASFFIRQTKGKISDENHKWEYKMEIR